MIIEIDKILHFSVSFVIAIAIYAFTKNFAVAFGATLMIGILKEVYDFCDYGLFSINDIIADTIGIVLALLLMTLL